MKKQTGYKVGALKRKLGVGKGPQEPGTMIAKMNAMKKPHQKAPMSPIIKKSNAQLATIASKKKVAVRGLI